MQRNVTLPQIYEGVKELSESVERLENAIETAKALEEKVQSLLNKTEINAEYLQLVYRRRQRNELESQTLISQIESLTQLKELIRICSDRIDVLSLSNTDHPPTPRT